MSLIFLTARPSSSARIESSIENSLERDMTIGYGFETITDTYKQIYRLSWQEPVTDRLNISSNFKITLDDLIESEGVDTKTFVPSFDVAFTNPVWDLSLALNDSITYSNEFNRRRGDAVSSSMEANVALNYFPELNYKFSRVFTYQEGFEDQVEEKTDARFSYSVGDAFNLESSWKETETEDSLESTLDREKTWNMTVDYSRILWEALKLDEVLAVDGTRGLEKDFDASTRERDDEHTLENKFKLTLTGFPAVDSSLELTNKKDWVEDTTTNTENFSMTLSGGSTKIGVFKPSLKWTLEDVASPVPASDTTSFTQEYGVEWVGSPSKYLDYSTKYVVSLVEARSGVNPGDLTQVNTFDLSLTGHPRTDLSLETAFNKSGTYTNGNITGTSRQFKLNLSYAGKSSNLPGLTVEPTIEMTDTWDMYTEIFTRAKSFQLHIDYENAWPDVLSFSVSPSYSLKTDHVGMADREVKLSYEVIAEFSLANADFRFTHKGDWVNTLDDEFPGGEFDLNKESWILLTPNLRSRVKVTAEYAYKTAPDGEASDNTKVNLSYTFPRFFDLDLSLRFENARTFTGPKDVERSYQLKMSMAF